MKIIFKGLFYLIICILLILSLGIVSAQDNDNLNILSLNNTVPTYNSENNGIWVLYEDMDSVNLDELSKMGIHNIFLSADAFSLDKTNPKTVKFISNAKSKNIKVHAWMSVFNNEGIWQYPKYNNSSFNKTYANKITKRVLKLVKNYDVAGIHLDYVRYAGDAYLHKGSSHAVTRVVKQISVSVKDYNPNLIVSAAVMPEITQYNSYYTTNEYFYGQNITELSKYLDIIVPMMYKGNFNENGVWIKNITQAFVNNSIKSEVWVGLQGYHSDYNTKLFSSSSLKKDVNYSIESGASGVVLFRYGYVSYFDFDDLDSISVPKYTSKTIKFINILDFLIVN